MFKRINDWYYDQPDGCWIALLAIGIIAFFAFLVIYDIAIEPRAKCTQYAQMWPDREIRYYSQFGCVEKRGGEWVILEFDLNRATETDSP